MNLTLTMLLRQHGLEKGLELLRQEPYCLKIQRDGDLLLFNYDQINSKPSDPVCQEARGLIIDALTLEPVAIGFHRFFNLGEGNAVTMEQPGMLRYLEKLDGSYISLYHYKGQWKTATRGNMHLTTLTPDKQTTFKALLNTALKHLNYDLLNTDFTYVLELLSPNNRVITSYDTIEVRLLGGRSRVTGRELKFDSEIQPLAKALGLKTPRVWAFASIEEAITALNNDRKQFAPTFEGFVALEETDSAHGHRRVKIKAMTYVAMHHFHETPAKSIATLLLSGETAEAKAVLPEHAGAIETAETKFQHFKHNLLTAYDAALAAASTVDATDKALHKKTFARIAGPVTGSSLLFQKYQNPSLPWNTIFATLKPTTLAQWLNL